MILGEREERAEQGHQAQIGRLREERQRIDSVAEPGRMARLHLELTLAYRGCGDEVGARKAYPRAMDFARKARDLPLQLCLLRLCRLFLEPDIARRHLEHAAELARGKGLELELALCLNNLATVCMELRLFETAEGHWRASLEILEALGQPAAVPLNNLGFQALALGDLDGAGELLGKALRVASEPGLSLMPRSNLAVVRARQGQAEGAVRELRLLKEGGLDPPAIRPAVLFNLARALLEARRAEEALRETVVPPPWQANDESLANATLASLRLRAYRYLGKAPTERGIRRQAKTLHVTTKPQAWLYRSLWARGDIQFLEEERTAAAG